MKNIKFIAIGGHGGSGKSTLAELLSKKLGAEIIHTDDFASWDNPVDWWPLVIDRIFMPIENGAKTLSYPRSKWWENHFPEPVAGQPVTKIMILEGVTALRKEFRPFVDYKIYVETPLNICLERGLARDINNNTGKSVEELTAMWNEWIEAEHEYMARDKPKDAADVIVDGTESFVPIINEIVNHKF